jgi:tyrosinase
MDYLYLNEGIERRVFVKGLGGMVGLGLFAAVLGGCESCREQIEKRPLRKRIRPGSPAVAADLATYRAAVAAMKALPASDPRNWLAQAGIHGTPAGFNLCQHGTDHFYSWHRAYLYYFERICQKLTGNKDFGLPYWNWNQNPQIHGDFLDPSSPLFNARNNTNLTGNPAISNAALDPMFTDTNFFTFGSQIEGTPHNIVHTSVGGQFGGGASARDPIFWSHHCMVDYTWAKWNLELSNDNPNSSAWTGQSWNHFFDDNGNPVETTAGLTTLMPLLSYRYESSVIGSRQARALPSSASEFKKLEARVRKGADVRFRIEKRIAIEEKATLVLSRPLTKNTSITLGEFSAIILPEKSTRFLFASIEYSRLPVASDFVVRLFINFPEANLTTATTHSNFAGSFAFFGTESSDGADHATHHHAAPKFLVNLTSTLRSLRSRQLLNETTPISLQLVAVPVGETFMRPDAELILNKLELIVTPVMIN